MQNMSENVKNEEYDKMIDLAEDTANEKINMYLFYLVYQLSRRKERETKKIVTVANRYFYMIYFIEKNQNLDNLIWYDLWGMLPFDNS